jgi:hypothetical protein
MWQPKIVERALLKWPVWHNSLIQKWVSWDDDVNVIENISQTQIEKTLDEMKLPNIEIFQIYWVACVTSKYNLDYPKTYDNIVMPVSYHVEYFQIGPNVRIYPPRIVPEKDLCYIATQVGLGYDWLKQYYSEKFSLSVLLKPDHGLLQLLRNMRGRPVTHGERGIVPRYCDRLAVRCAVLKRNGLSFVNIANKLNLGVTRPWSSDQSDRASYLVKRGNKLLGEFSSSSLESSAKP